MSCCERSSYDRWLLAGALGLILCVVLYGAVTGGFDAPSQSGPPAASGDGAPTASNGK